MNLKDLYIVFIAWVLDGRDRFPRNVIILLHLLYFCLFPDSDLLVPFTLHFVTRWCRNGKIRSEWIRLCPDGNIRLVFLLHSNEVEQKAYSTTLLCIGNISVTAQWLNLMQRSHIALSWTNRTGEWKLMRTFIKGTSNPWHAVLPSDQNWLKRPCIFGRSIAKQCIHWKVMVLRRYQTHQVYISMGRHSL